MKSWRFFAAIAALCLPACGAWAAGALAVDNHGNFGVSRNHHEKGHAIRLAMDNCGHPACHVVLEFEGACAAYARASNGHEGWATGERDHHAIHHAIENCEAYGGRDCRMITVQCDGL